MDQSVAKTLSIWGRLLGTAGETYAIGLLSRADFVQLKRECAAHRFPDNYDEWLDEREGLQIGLSAAGVQTSMTAVDLALFLEWCQASSRSIDNDAIDAFVTTTLRADEDQESAREFIRVPVRSESVHKPRLH